LGDVGAAGRQSRTFGDAEDADRDAALIKPHMPVTALHSASS
jgi:hypothetical protein